MADPYDFGALSTDPIMEGWNAGFSSTAPGTEGASAIPSDTSAFGYPAYGVPGTSDPTASGLGYPAYGDFTGGASGALVSWTPPDQSSAPGDTAISGGVTATPSTDYNPNYSGYSNIGAEYFGYPAYGVAGENAGSGGALASWYPGQTYAQGGVSLPGSIPGIGWQPTAQSAIAPAGYANSPWSSEGEFFNPANTPAQDPFAPNYPAVGAGGGLKWAQPNRQGPTLASVIAQLESQGGLTAGQQPKGMTDPTYGQYPDFSKQYGSGAAGVNAFGDAVLAKRPNATVADYYANYVLNTGNPGGYNFNNLQTTRIPGAQGAAQNFINNAGVAPSTPLSSMATTGGAGGGYIEPASYAANYGSPAAAVSFYTSGAGGSYSPATAASPTLGVPTSYSQAGQYKAH